MKWVTIMSDNRFALGEYMQRPEGVQTGHGDIIPHIGVGYAVSRDGVNWEKPLDDLLIRPRGVVCERDWKQPTLSQCFDPVESYSKADSTSRAASSTAKTAGRGGARR